MKLFLEILLKILPNIFILLFLYQFIYLLVGLFKKPMVFEAKKQHRYAILISAKNEENVIAHLIHSILNQEYPKELIQVFVVADNCSDQTADVSRGAGATVYERYDSQQLGKGYALQYLLRQIDKDYGLDTFEGYLVFDADNLLEKNYIQEINKVFDNGYRIITSYGNTTDPLDQRRHRPVVPQRSQIYQQFPDAAGRQLPGVRHRLPDAQGYRQIERRLELLPVDRRRAILERILKGEKIGYCEDAIFYDEQPLRFRDSWNQRLPGRRAFTRYSMNMAASS